MARPYSVVCSVWFSDLLQNSQGAAVGRVTGREVNSENWAWLILRTSDRAICPAPPTAACSACSVCQSSLWHPARVKDELTITRTRLLQVDHNAYTFVTG